MSKFQMLRWSVQQRLAAAAEEILLLFEGTIGAYEEELRRSRVENERKQNILDAVLNPQVLLERAIKEEVLPEQQECSPSVDQEDPEPPHIKEEQEELWTSQEGEQLQGLEEAVITKFPSTPAPLKTEDERKPQSSQLYQSQTEENREETDEWGCGGSETDSSFQLPDLNKKTKPPASSSTEETETEADGEECIGSGPAMSLVHIKDLKRRAAPKSCCRRTFDNMSSLESHVETTARFSQNANTTGHTSHVVETKITKSSNNAKNNDVGCGKTFNQKANLHVHMNVPTGEKPFSCSVCKKHFAQKNYFMRHMARHTEEKLSSVCDSTCPDKSTLCIHMKVHTEERPFSCPVCKKRFKQSSHVREHMVLHTGEKYVCSVCGKSFSHKSNLHRHMKIHTGERPFTCPFCEKHFAHKNSLQKHTEIHTRKKTLNSCGGGAHSEIPCSSSAPCPVITTRKYNRV